MKNINKDKQSGNLEKFSMIRFLNPTRSSLIALLCLCLAGLSCTQKNSVESTPNPGGGTISCLITASTDSLPIGGGKVTLIWTSHNASSASISPNIGSVAIGGIMSVSLKKTTMFILTVSNGSASASDTILVVVETPGGLVASFSASVDSLPFGGGNVTLTWSSQVATAATITPGIGPVPTSGDTTIDVHSTTTFILTVSNNGYSLSDTVTVFVTPTWQFIYPLAVGNTWTYDYSYYYSGTTTRDIHGVHVWSVVAKDSAYGRLSYQMLDQENDTLFMNSKATPQTVSKTFFIVVTTDSIFANWTTLVRETIASGASISHFPRFLTTQVDTLRLGTLPAATYVDALGLVNYMNGASTTQSYTTESMVLVSTSFHSPHMTLPSGEKFRR